MARSALGDIPITSVDIDRLGIVTSTPVATATDEPGRGSIYDLSKLAAGRLFHCHRSDNAFLLSFSTIWTDATAAANAPGTFSAKTAYNRPTFWWTNPTSDGSNVGAISGYGTPAGQLYPQGDATLRITSAVSIGDMLVYLGTHKGGQFLVTFRVSKGSTQFIGSQWLTPISDGTTTTTWDRGVFGFGNHLYVVGSQPNSTLMLCKIRMGSTVQSYLSSTGWTLDQTLAEPLLDASGAAITSEGNVSLATYRDTWVMSTVADAGPNWAAKFWRCKHPLQGFRPLAHAEINLGPKTTSAMLCGAFLQQSVTVNPDHDALLSGTVAAGGLAYTYTVESATALRTNWGVLAVPHFRL